MKTILKLNIRSNEGYSASQVLERRKPMTVGELREFLEGIDDDMEIVTYDENNERGASWGTICYDGWDDCYEVEEDE